MTRTYDIVVIGGGIGGYSAAIRAAQLGKSVAIVEKDKLGGTCLHRGCIPSKALLRSAELFATMKRSEEFGISASQVELKFEKVQARKRAVVEQLYKGVQYLMQKNKIEIIQGSGRVIGPSIFSPRSGAVAIELPNGEAETIVPTNLILATGSVPRLLPGLKADGKRILTSDEALELEELPKSIVIIGGGVIGVEWASMMSDFGAQVTIVEADARLLPGEDEDISRELERLFKKRGVRVLTKALVQTESVEATETGAALTVVVREQPERLEAEAVLVCVGRQANVRGLGLENTDVKLVKGVIQVNDQMQTTESHIYAVGDVNGGLQLAHVAAHEGIRAAEHIAGADDGHAGATQPHQVPRCVYSRPEIASIGWTEKQAKEQGREVKIGKFSFKALGKAVVLGEADGFVKVVADARTQDLLGVHIIGPHATDQIGEAAVAQLLDAAHWEIGKAIHAHPTLSEALGEAMLAVDGLSLGI
ncbi:dihydrolipoyl dehydrogenase [Paenibacillus koleovorans]|uniref:dihydrolipoyl dehydrogenase n=1 Tax=Paenibacillus koleovorans TaxID=121608 RepID=UPI000FDB9C20|nr:dihydrolipoyl dehydrogenase [Paenibacillus koleovorans]